MESIFKEIGFSILATGGTHEFLLKNGIDSEAIKKVGHGRPDIVDAIKNDKIQLVVNTPNGKEISMEDDSYIRKSAIKYKIPYITTTAASLAAAKGIKERKMKDFSIKSLQEQHAEIG